MKRKQYIIVFGDADEVIKATLAPPSETLEVRPFLFHLQSKYNSTKTDIVEILMDAKDPAMVLLSDFFPNVEALRAHVDKKPTEYMDLEEELGYYVVGVGKELSMVSVDDALLSDHVTMKNHDFPDKWEKASAPLLLSSGKIKEMSSGAAGALDLRVLDVQVFSWARERNIEIEDFDKLHHLTMTNVFLFNDQLLQTDRNAPFTVYCRKGEKTKGKLKLVEG